MPTEPPAAAVEPAELTRICIGFVDALRIAGLDIGLGSSVLFQRSLGVLGVERRASLYWAGRATLVQRPEDIPLYNAIFANYWADAPLPAGRMVEDIERVTLAVDDEDAPEGDESEDQEDDGETITVRYSPIEVLRDKDFAEYTDAELAEAQRLMAEMRLVTATRRSRRMVKSKRMRGTPDLRRTVRAALASEGEPIRRRFQKPGVQARRLVLLLDISGSMEAYARALLRFVHAAVVGRRRVEAFSMGTRLTRLTRQLSSRDPDAAFRTATERVEDWSGGTRLGVSLREFNDHWGVRGMARGAVVVVLSDGWDRGDPADLAEQMERLSRVTHRLVWVNPLKASPGYAPLAQGMAAALPYVDEFIEGHSLASLEELARVIRA